MLLKEFLFVLAKTEFKCFMEGKKGEKNTDSFDLRRFGQSNYGDFPYANTINITIKRLDGYSKSISYYSFSQIDEKILNMELTTIDDISLLTSLSVSSSGNKYVNNHSKLTLTVQDNQ